MPYDPRETYFPYPDRTDCHYLKVKKNDGTVFDKNYPYVDKSKRFVRKQKLLRALMFAIAFPVVSLRQGLRIEGRKKLRENRGLIADGIVSVGNHIHMWDYIAVMRAAWPHVTNILSWAPDISGENGTLIRLTGGIPVPENDLRATGAFSRAVEQLLTEDHGWLHVCAEGSMWEFYQPIRPFKQGAFYYAVKCGKPVLPMAFSFREVKGLAKLFWKHSFLTLRIGDPIYADETLDRAAAVDDLAVRAHREVCRLAGIDPDENLYPPLFDNTQRIDYYTDTYGVGYKGSW